MKYVRLFLLVGCVCGTVSSARADTFEDGLQAAKRGDYAAAMAQWKPLAEQGNAMAQFNIGMMYARGRGVAEDPAQALHWYRMAAQKGYADAQLNLGVMYNSGQGVKVDHAEALQWLRLAAAQGVAKAHYNLGAMYAMGHGVARDYQLAYVYFTLAENYGYDQAVGDSERVARMLSSSQRDEAQALIQYWRPGRPLPNKMAASR